MDLASIFKEFLSGRKTGQLLIKFEGERHLCKVHIEDGNVVYISIGTKKPDETIGYIADRQPVETNFIEGIPPIKKLDEPLNHKLHVLTESVNGDPGPGAGFSIDAGDP